MKKVESYTIHLRWAQYPFASDPQILTTSTTSIGTEKELMQGHRASTWCTMVVKTRHGKNSSFPKGGRDTEWFQGLEVYSESKVRNTVRETFEETGISPNRYCLLPLFSQESCNTGYFTILVDADSSYVLGQPDARGVGSWKPPHEDPDDKNPVVNARWVSVLATLVGQSGLSGRRIDLCKHAFREFIGTFLSR